jgi:cobalt-zinc-cadmium efflux system membrane fusion protein
MLIAFAPRLSPGALARAALVAALSGPAFSASDAGKPAAEFPVTAAQMQSLGVTLVKLEQPGAIRGMLYPARVVLPAGQELMVSAPVAGVVEQLMVTDHQAVRAGQPLVRLVSPQLGELQLRLLEAANKSRLSAKTLERERQLFNEGIVPERRVQEAEAAAMDDTARRKQAEAALRLAGVDAPTISRIAGGAALVDGLTIRARQAGVVLGLDVKPGQRVQEADALLRVASTSLLWLEVQVPSDRVGTAVPNGVIESAGRDVQAVATNIASTVSDSQTVSLRARVTKGGQALRPGEVLQVHVPFAANAAGWSLPLQAVARDGEQAHVFVRTEKGFVAKPVAVVASAGQSVQVTGDLKPGQQVAVSSVIALKAAWQGKGGGD